MTDPQAAEAFGAWMKATLDGTEYQEPRRDTRTPAEQFADFMNTNLGQPATTQED